MCQIYTQNKGTQYKTPEISGPMCLNAGSGLLHDPTISEKIYITMHIY